MTQSAHAATLRVSPDTGVYTVGGTFTANVIINTQNKAVNAADGQLSYNPKELSVVSVSRASSIFNLWTQEPSFSNTLGTISFGGGSPTGYTGASGNILTITFRPLGAGNPKVTFKSGSVLAADGLGTNVLTSMTGSSYTISAVTSNPEPEYIAPANTPKAPVVTSTTHGNQETWYKNDAAELSWELPSGIIAVRTLLDTAPSTIPTIVYDEPIRSRTLEDLPQGISYFHIQFKNAEGWGRVTHFKIQVDSEAPSAFTVSEDTDFDPSNPKRTLQFTVEDISPVTRYKIQIDATDPFEYLDEEETRKYVLPSIAPGHHTLIVEAFDGAGNSRVATYSFDITAFEKPLFTEYPSRINAEVIPALRGTTRPDAQVEVSVTPTDGATKTYTLKSDGGGAFIFIPDAPFEIGVYDITAIATDMHGATSDVSDPIRIIVEEPGFVRIGSFVVTVLSVLVPLISLSIVLIFGCWYLWHRLAVWRRKVEKETLEVESIMKIELDEVMTNMHKNVEKLKESRKGKLTQAENTLIDQIETDLADARSKIRKEISDIEHIVQ